MKKWIAGLLMVLLLLFTATAFAESAVDITEMTEPEARDADKATQNYAKFARLKNMDVVAVGAETEIWLDYDSKGVGNGQNIAANYITYLVITKDGELVESKTIRLTNIKFYESMQVTTVTLTEPGIYTFSVATGNGTDAPDTVTVSAINMPATSEKLALIDSPANGSTITDLKAPIYVYLQPLRIDGQVFYGDALYNNRIGLEVRKNGNFLYGTDYVFITNGGQKARNEERVQIGNLDLEVGGNYTLLIKMPGSSTPDQVDFYVDGPAYPEAEANNPGYYITPTPTSFTLDLNGNDTAHIDYTMSICEDREAWYQDYMEDGKRVVRFNGMSDNVFQQDGEQWTCQGWVEYKAVSTGTAKLHIYINAGKRYDEHTITFNVIDSSHPHTWAAPTYTWASDHSTVTASRKCPGCGTEETETVQATYAIANSPTQTAMGSLIYTSSAFENSAFAVQTITVDEIPALSKMKCLTLPADLTTIENGAFAGDTGFDCIIIPNSVTFIGEGAFSGCGELIYIQLPKHLKEYAEAAFASYENVLLDYKE